MQISDIHEAKSDLSKLIELAMRGEDVILSQNGCPMVRLVPIEPDNEPRRGGQWQGQVWIADDFDELPEDIAKAFGVLD